jgi:hypothetical protein
MKTAQVILLLIASANLAAQRAPENWCSKNEYSVMRFYQGDSILVNCDTVFLINTATYKLYADVFKNFNAKNSDVKRLVTLFDQSKALYENRIQQQGLEYQALKKEFDGLMSKSQTVVQQTTDKLSAVDNSLVRIDRNVASAQANIEEAKNLIRQEIRLGNKQRLKWGLGGLVVGVGITTILFAIVD